MGVRVRVVAVLMVCRIAGAGVIVGVIVPVMVIGVVVSVMVVVVAVHGAVRVPVRMRVTVTFDSHLAFTAAAFSTH